jgi:L-Lysine epsilon oxidase N-terminal/L-lysine epsilon oxidase C-terminal domain
MAAKFRIHPAIGIARLGNSPDKFCIVPDQGGELPIACDSDGNPALDAHGQEESVTDFTDGHGRIMRQASRFRVFTYDDKSPGGREVLIGDQVDIVEQRSGQLKTYRVDDILWTVYLANKKSSWYAFKETDGEHGYAADYPLRNADITNSEDRQRLIIDPGPRSVSFRGTRRAAFDDKSSGPTSFPPELVPHSITTLGELLCTETSNANRLLVLGGFGNSGSMQSGFGNPKIEEYANNDGWFDDTSDGPVQARFIGTLLAIDGRPVTNPGAPVLAPATIDPAWVMVGYPRFVPQALDVVTMDDIAFDIAVRQFGYVPYLYGVRPFDGAAKVPQDEAGLKLWRGQATWNSSFRPYFRRDILPILLRPLDAQNFMDLDPLTGGNPHSNAPGGNFDFTDLAVPPFPGEPDADRIRRREKRQFLYGVLRKPGQDNELFAASRPSQPGKKLFAMPLLCGDNPLSNVAPAKFLRLTDTMLFLLKQWADGLFIDEQAEDIVPEPMHPGAGAALDRGALAAGLGGAFCPGGEATWIVRNPAIYAGAYRIRRSTTATQGELSQPGASRLAGGLEPGDLTKYSAVPWQSDFNECTNQVIDMTYQGWNDIDPDSIGDPVAQTYQLTYWWPVHRPFYYHLGDGSAGLWSPTSQNNAGDLAMVTAWAQLRFFIRDGSGGFTFAPVATTPPAHDA